jgi:rare lipoprotein A
VKEIIKLSFGLALISCSWHATSQNQGYASFYSKHLKGRRTSDKSNYHPDSLTCAHLSYPLGAYLKVRNLNNDSIVIVKVTDRGPHSRRRIIDLSYRAAKQLDFIRQGTCMVEVTPLDSSLLVQDSLKIDTLLDSDSLNLKSNAVETIEIRAKISKKHTRNKRHKRASSHHYIKRKGNRRHTRHYR